MRYAIAVVIVVTTLVAFSCSNERGGFLARLLKGGGGAIPVTVESVVAREKTQSVSIPATIEAAESATVTLPEDATVERVFVTEGTAVAAGAELLKLSEEETNARLSRLRGDLRDAQSKLDRNNYILKNRDRMLDEERIDRAQYDSAEADVQAASNDVDRIKQDIGKLETRLGDLTVKSPIAGVVTKRSISPGLAARAGDPLLTISKTDPAIATFRLVPEEAAAAQPGTEIKVRLPLATGEIPTGKIASVGTQLNPEDKTITVRATIPNAASAIKAGMQAMVEITSPRTQRVYVIPEDSLIRDPRGYFVFTVVKGTAHKVQVIPGEVHDRHIEITRGLKDEDVVVVRGQDKLAEGTAVDMWGR
jgi:membrane fusion protein, multidrug efflux system